MSDGMALVLGKAVALARNKERYTELIAERESVFSQSRDARKTCAKGDQSQCPIAEKYWSKAVHLSNVINDVTKDDLIRT